MDPALWAVPALLLLNSGDSGIICGMKSGRLGIY